MQTMTRRTATVGAAAALVLGALLGACGSDAETGADTTTTTAGSGYEEIPMAQVLTQIPTMLAAGESAQAAAEADDFDQVLADYEELHEVWEAVEGTIKATDRDLYEAIETAQSLIKDGGENEDADRVDKGARDQASALDRFVKENG